VAAGTSFVAVFLRTADNRLWQRTLAAGGTDVWSTLPIGGASGGGIAVFARGTNNVVYANSGDTGSWTGWSRLGGETLTSPAVAWGYQAGRLDVFVAGTTGGLFQKALVNGTWTGWIRLDTTLPSSARIAAAARSGRLVVYASAGGATTYKQYVGRWVGYNPVPYTCDTCLPEARSAGTFR
jgi:hypothetical protein